MTVLSIIVNTISIVQLTNGKDISEKFNVFFPGILSKVKNLVEKYGEAEIGMVSIHGPVQFTSRLMPEIQEILQNTTIIVDGGKGNA